MSNTSTTGIVNRNTNTDNNKDVKEKLNDLKYANKPSDEAIKFRSGIYFKSLLYMSKFLLMSNYCQEKGKTGLLVRKNDI